MATAEINGFDMSYDIAGDGPALLLLHGFTGCKRDWDHVFDLDALAGEFTVIAPDARGHGESTNPEGGLSHRLCAADTLALLDALDIDRVVAVGASMGGNTLLHMATQVPQRIRAMVVSGAPSYFPETARAMMRELTASERGEAEWAEMRQRHPRGDEQIRALWDIGASFATRYDDMCFTPPQLATITAKTLLVNGDRDPLYPVEMFIDMYRAIPDSACWIVPDAGHAPIFGNPTFAERAVAFLKRALASRADQD